jgi:hypothetical protein
VTTEKSEASSTEPRPLGEEGDACAQCGTELAIDQRYCLHCGTARGGPRLDYQRALGGNDAAASSGKSAGSGSGMQWSPLLAIVAIAILAVMLLLGVLIGQDDNDVTVTEVPATTATAPATAATEPPPATTPTTDNTTPDASGGAAVPDTGTTKNPKGTGREGAGDAGGIAPND